ncbi:unnamed protein product, partial [Closterium sp. NIES-54]
SAQQPSALPPQAAVDPEGAGVRTADPGGANSGAVPGSATTGGAGAPSAGPGEPRTGRIAAGGASSEGGATGALESGHGATTAPDTTPSPHPYPTLH